MGRRAWQGGGGGGRASGKAPAAHARCAREQTVRTTTGVRHRGPDLDGGERASGRLLLAVAAAAADELARDDRRVDVLHDDLAGDEDPGGVGVAGDLVHDV